MRYKYKAKKGPKEIIEGFVEAANQDAAVSKIIAEGLVPVLVQKESEHLAKEPMTHRVGSRWFLFDRKVSKGHIYLFTKQLRVLLKAQMPILNSLYILEDQVENRSFKKILEGIIGSVKEGASFSDSLAKFPQHFPPLYLSIMKAGEASGKLDDSLDEIAEYMDRDKQLAQKVKSSLTYPLFMIVVGIFTVIFLMTFVIPKLGVLFEDFSEQIPLITKILLAVSLILSKNWILLLTLFTALILFFFKNRNTPLAKKIFAGIKKRVPLVKDIIRNQSLFRFARGMAILLSSGISILESISISTSLLADPIAEKELTEAYEQVVSGSSLEESFGSSCRFLPKIFITMIAVGEASGRLDEILEELANSYSDEIETQTKIMTSIVEPLAILLVGGALGFIAIAILLPIFEISFAIN
ncbi:MAG: type II secretion system F family protein [Candidatus Omnitrophica bacterium]|nr:type II secretion system F family protein [Candidatus Omnitrophota bacterium]